MFLLHLNAATLAPETTASSLWHRLVPRTRLLCALFFVFATTLTPNGQWWTWVWLGAGVLSLMVASRVDGLTLLKRVALESTFVGTVLLGTLFRSGGETLWQWGMLKVTTVGLMVLGSVSFKAILCLLMLNFLVLTTPLPDLLEALAALRMPPLLIAILASMMRYVGLMTDEFNRMRRAAISRNLLSQRQRQRQLIGNMIGSLFIRTYDRGDRIHQAMLSRGYRGPMAKQTSLALHRRDRWALAGCLVFLSAGWLIG
jgi:cobalt/nickel transport system permease protein